MNNRTMEYGWCQNKGACGLPALRPRIEYTMSQFKFELIIFN